MTRTLIVSYDAPAARFAFKTTDPPDVACLTVATSQDNTGSITVIRTVMGAEATELYKELVSGKDTWRTTCLNRPWETT